MPQTSWVNQDGLKVRFGRRDQTEDNTAPAAVVTAGLKQQAVLRIKGTALADTCTFAAGTLDERGARIPGNAYITSATLHVDEAFTTSASGVLDIGLYKVDGSAHDDDGIDVAIAAGTLVANADIACDGAEVGKLLAVTAPSGRTDNSVILGASYDTGAFTAGTATLIVEYIVPVGP